MVESLNKTPLNQHWHWFRRGLSCLISIPALILMGAFIGFTGLARDAGFTLAQTEFMVFAIWALPSKVVLVGAVLAKSSLVATFIAVCLSSFRLLPMVVAIVPEMKTDKTRKSTLYMLSHFVAVTGWVMAFERFPKVPRQYRTSFFAGLVFTLLGSNMLLAVIVYEVSDKLPALVSAALIFITPLYFTFSLWGSARDLSSHYAIIAGLALTPLSHHYLLQVDMLVAGIGGGILAHMIAKSRKARAKI